MRALIWFSAGAASAAATKIVLSEWEDDLLIARIDTGSEHPDNERFARECEHWFGHDVETFKSERYRDTWQVWEERRYLVGPDGALCTAELKKKVRYQIERPGDRQVFGFTSEEKKRADRFREQNPEIDLWTPLIDHGLTKSDCLALVERAGIDIPEMYRLGFQNNNCVPCVKAGIGYWNKIRKEFPKEFDRMAKLERTLGHSVLREDIRLKTGDRSIWLDELDPERGSHPDEPSFDCSLFCSAVEVKLEKR